MSALFRIAITFLVVALLWASASPSFSQSAEKEDFCFCSMASLLATPGKYDGIRVRTNGVATIGFEADAIYLTKEHAREGILANAISIRLPSEDPAPWNEFKHLSGKYVLIEGIFHKPDPLEIGFRGSISDVKYLYALEDVEIMD